MKWIRKQKNDLRNPRIAIIGVGNDFRGDDAAGLLCARKLKKCLNQNEAEVVELSGDISELLEAIPKWDAVIIVDAVQSIATPGTILRIDLVEASKSASHFNSSTHTLDLLKLLELLKNIDKLDTQVIVYGIVGSNFSFSTTVSADVNAATECICEHIRWELCRLACQ
jgi:hydrogenase maturation protease